jgi:signal transduction histidine kinase
LKTYLPIKRKRTILTLLFFFASTAYAILNKEDADAFLNDREKSEELVEAYIEKGKTYDLTRPDSMQYYFFKALDIVEKAELGEDKLAYLYNGIGASYYVTSNFPQALEYYLRAFQLYKKSENAERIAASLNNIALIYASQEDFDKAISYHRQAMDLAGQLNDSNSLATNYLNLGIIYFELGKIDSSFIYLNRSLSYKSNKPSDIAIAKNKIGQVYHKLGDFEKAISQFRSMIAVNAYDLEWELGFAHVGLGHVYLTQNKLDSAIAHLRKGYDMFIEQNARWDVVQAGEVLGEAYYKNQDYSKAYAVLTKILDYQKEYLSVDQIQDINYLMRKNEELISAQLSQENIIQQQIISKRNTYLVISICILIVLTLTILSMRRAFKRINALNRDLYKKNSEIKAQKKHIEIQNQKLQESDALKTKILSIISHDIRSPLNSINKILSMTNEGLISIEEQQVLLGKLQTNVNSLSYNLNNLLHWAASQITETGESKQPVNLKQIISETLEFWQYESKEKEIDLSATRLPESDVIFSGGKEQLRIILRNLTGNALKFTKGGGSVSIALHEDKNRIIIEVIDTGIGMDKKTLDKLRNKKLSGNVSQGTHLEKGTGIGMLLCNEFAEKNNGYIEVESTRKKGSTFRLVLNKND